MNEDVRPTNGTLAAALRTIAAEPPGDLQALRHAIVRRAAPELARRRARARRGWLILPASLAASIALLLYSVPLPFAPDRGLTQTRATDDGGGPAIERLLDADVSERQFRALLFGATNADELLLIAAGDNGQRRDEAR
jgi:hypothetical protein